MAGEEGEASAARKLSTATSILARTYRQRNRTRESPQQKAPEEEMGEAEKALASGGASMSAEQRRLSAPKSDAAATFASAIGGDAAVRGAGEPPSRVLRALANGLG